MTIRKYLLILVTLILSLTLFGCGGRFGGQTDDDGDTTMPDNSNGDGPREKVTISYWNLLTGADGATMREMVKSFNEEYNGVIEVVEQSTNEVDYYEILNLNIPIGRGPDVAIMHSYYVQSYANRELIVSIDNLVNNSEINLADYPEDILQSLNFDDKLYGIPLDMHPIGIYYNKDLLDQYGCDVPTNRSELIECAKKAPNNEGDVWGLPISAEWPSDYTFTSALYQNNGLEIDENGNPGYDTQEGVNAITSFADLIHKHKLSPTHLGNDQDLFYFQNGNAMFHFQGSWMLNSMIESDVNFGVIPLSKMFNENSDTIAIRSHTFVFPYQSSVNHDKRQASMTFVKYLSDQGAKWANAGQIPASQVARETDEYKNLDYLEGFGEIENFRIAAPSPFYHEAFTPIYSRVTYALQNPNYDAQDLIKMAVEEALLLIKESKEFLE